MSKGEKRTRRVVLVGFAACALLVATAYPRSGQASPAAATAPSLGTATSFAVLAGSTVTNTGPSTVNGDLGVSPGSAVSGFPPGIVTGGSIHRADAVAAGAQSDTTIAYNNLAGQPCNFNLTGQDLGGKTLVAGVYCFSTSAQLTGSLTLNGQGDPGSVFIFQIGSTLTTASASRVLLINGAQSCNVFWQVGSSATLGTGTAFAGSILALTSISLTTNASVSGRALARNGAVTMDTNRVFRPQCAPAATSTPTATAPVSQTATPTSTVAPATATALVATATARAATSTAVAATATAAAATSTAAAATSTAIAATATASAATATVAVSQTATSTPVLPTSTVAAATSTAAAPTSTASAATATAPPATNTPVPATAPPPTKPPTRPPTRAPTVAPPKPVPGITPPRTGFGGTAPYVYTSSNAQRLVRSLPSRGTASAPINTGVTNLPRTGGGSGSPAEPLAPLTLLAMAAIGAGRVLRKLKK